MKQEKCWVLYCYDADAKWRFSTKELAERAIKFFELKEDEYRLDEEDLPNLFDDEELLEYIAFAEEKENA